MELNQRQLNVIKSTAPRILCLSSSGSGKALPNSVKIPTPQGFKTVGEIKPGDFLFDREGKPTKVLEIFPQGKKEVYEITFADSRTAKCSKDHIWTVNKQTWKNKNKYRELALAEILSDKWNYIDNEGTNIYQYKIPVAKAVKYSKKSYTIPPYAVGAFLGNGCHIESTPFISSIDEELVDKINQLINSRYTIEKGKNFLEELRYLCQEQRIPLIYKYGNIEQRLELIQGLMDISGSITRNNGKYNVNFITSNSILRDDFIEVMGSLGYVCSFEIDNRECGFMTEECYKININITNSEKHELFSLTRKKDIALECVNKIEYRDYTSVAIQDIQDLGYEEEMTCFLVDNEEHLFLTENFIVTHNTRVLTERIRHLVETGVKPEQITAVTFTNMARDEMKDRLGDMSKNMFIGTIHSLANKICLNNGIDTQPFIDGEKFDRILTKALTIPASLYPMPEHLLIDECQDLSALDYSFLEKIPAKNIFFVGDDRQMIFTFRGSSLKYLEHIFKDIKFTKYSLTQNYRTRKEILRFANDFLSSYRSFSPTAIPTKDGGIVDLLQIEEALDKVEESKNKGSWFILCRTNNEVNYVQWELTKRGIENITFKRGDLNLSEMDSVLASNKVKVLTIHSAKGLSSKNVIVIGARTSNINERKVAYVAATRAEDLLYWCPGVKKKNLYQNKGEIATTKSVQNLNEGLIMF